MFRKILALFVLVFFSVGCATVQPPAPIYSGKDLIEQQLLPPDPATETLQAKDGKTYPGDEKQVAAVTKNDPAPFDGICESEARAARDGDFRVRYLELRTTVTANNSVVAAQRAQYEGLIAGDKRTIEDLRPTFIEKHALVIGLTLGVIVGVGLSIATEHAISGR